MKLWEYVLQHDKKSDFIKHICEFEFIDGEFLKYDSPMPHELFIKRDYCPAYFECFKNTEFEKPLDPYKDKKRSSECKYSENDSFNLDEAYHDNKEKMFKNFYKERTKCSNCWDREIIDKNDNENDEYRLYLELKKKFETQ
jgi:hypothetical protein